MEMGLDALDTKKRKYTAYIQYIVYMCVCESVCVIVKMCRTILVLLYTVHDMYL